VPELDRAAEVLDPRPQRRVVRPRQRLAEERERTVDTPGEPVVARRLAEPARGLAVGGREPPRALERARRLGVPAALARTARGLLERRGRGVVGGRRGRREVPGARVALLGVGLGERAVRGPPRGRRRRAGTRPSAGAGDGTGGAGRRS
jgi:hypothetical protein